MTAFDDVTKAIRDLRNSTSLSRDQVQTILGILDKNETRLFIEWLTHDPHVRADPLANHVQATISAIRTILYTNLRDIQVNKILGGLYPAKAQQFFATLSKKPGFRPNKQIYTTMLKKMSTILLDLTTNLLNDQEEDKCCCKFPPQKRAGDRCICLPQRIAKVITEMEERQGYTCLSLQIDRIIKEMRDPVVGLDDIGYQTIICYYVDVGRVDDAASAYSVMRSACLDSPIGRKKLISALIVSEDYNSLYTFMDQTVPQDRYKHENTFDTLMFAAVKLQDPMKVEMVINKKKNWSVIPSDEDYTKLISVNVTSGNLEGAERCLEVKRNEGREVTVKDYTMIIGAYTKRQLSANAEHLLHEMDTFQVPADSYTVSHLLELEDRQSALNLVSLSKHACNELLLKPVTADFNTILRESTKKEVEDGPQRLVNVLVNFLQMGDRDDQIRACLIWDAAVVNRIYTVMTGKASQGMWKINLHDLSTKSAIVALSQSLKKLQVQGMKREEQLTIVTGWGRHSSTLGVSPVKEAVTEMLKKLEFPISGSGEGWFISGGDELMTWLNNWSSDQL